MREKTLAVKHIVVKMAVARRLDGTASVNLRCASPGCPTKCAMCFEMPKVLLFANDEKLAELLSLHCNALAKVERKTVKLAGLKEAKSSVGG